MMMMMMMLMMMMTILLQSLQRDLVTKLRSTSQQRVKLHVQKRTRSPRCQIHCAMVKLRTDVRTLQTTHGGREDAADEGDPANLSGARFLMIMVTPTVTVTVLHRNPN
jgi:hypothetical protein